jgi:tetratricopeptide (TPR) repeat protein
VIRPNLRTAAGLLIVLASLASGCQWLSQNIMQDDRQAEKRRQRAEAVARSIDQQHEQADVIAARDLWQRGDHEGCKRRLNELLTRNPDQLEARLLLAEVLLDENQAQEGIRVLKPAEAAHHDDARVQYSMGLLLDASGSQAGARSHYQAAARLEPGNEVYTVSYNEAVTSAKGVAPLDSGENKDLKECDPSVPPPPSDAAAGLATPASSATAGSSGSAEGTVGQANRGTPSPQADRPPAPGRRPQESQLPVILPPAAPLPAVSADQPGPQIIRQDFSTPPPIAPVPPLASAPTTPSAPVLVSAPEPDNLPASPSSPPAGPLAKVDAPPLPSFFPQTSRNDPRPQASQADSSLETAKSCTPNSAFHRELPMPMLLALPTAPLARSGGTSGQAGTAEANQQGEKAGGAREVSILAAAPAPAGPEAPAAASQPNRLPPQTAAAQKLQLESASPGLRFVDAAGNSGAIEISDSFGEAAGVGRTAHTEPIEPAKSTEETVGLPNRGLGTAAQASGGAPTPPAPLAARTDHAAHSEPLDPPKGAAAEDLLRQGAEALSAAKTDVAMAFFREAAASRPQDPQIPISAAVAALRQNHPEVAVDLLDAAASRFPKSAAVYRALGMACYRRTDYRAAESALKQALLLDKANPLSYFLLGCTLVKLGQQPAADECFRQARLLDPKYAVPRQPGQMP